MDWAQFGIMIVSFVGLFVWNRTEGRADNRQAQSMMQGMQTQIIAIQQEIKDFHGRLCTIEERNKSK